MILRLIEHQDPILVLKQDRQHDRAALARRNVGEVLVITTIQESELRFVLKIARRQLFEAAVPKVSNQTRRPIPGHTAGRDHFFEIVQFDGFQEFPWLIAREI